ncbi:hypothetical protein, partial [Streptomyces fildesensis]|uniref:hypothetical protein n=1 Tax=Streptomyces fildesensis TaxID=375757 RepID=UPI001E598A5A
SSSSRVSMRSTPITPHLSHLTAPARSQALPPNLRCRKPLGLPSATQTGEGIILTGERVYYQLTMPAGTARLMKA